MNLLFQIIREEHLDMIRLWRMSEDVTKYLYTDPKITPDDQKKWYQQITKDVSRMDWVINIDGEDVGVVGLYDIDTMHRRCFWAYYLAEKEVRGKGVGRAVELNILDYVFSELDLHKLCCEVFEWNDYVIKIHEKYGSTIEGIFREHIWKRGRYNNVVRMGILANEWEENIKEKLQFPRVEIEEWESKKNYLLSLLSN